MCGFSVILLSKGVKTFKVKKSMLFVEKKYKTLIKTKRTRKWKIPRTLLQRRTLRIKSKTDGWKLADEKRRVFFVPLILSEGNFFNICVLSRDIVCWTYFYIWKKITSCTFLLFLKIVESLQCIHKIFCSLFSQWKTSFFVQCQLEAFCRYGPTLLLKMKKLNLLSVSSCKSFWLMNWRRVTKIAHLQ